MRIFIRGTDKGNAMLTALVLVMVLSTLFVAFAGRVTVLRRFAREYKAEVLRGLEGSNREAMSRYDFR